MIVKVSSWSRARILSAKTLLIESSLCDDCKIIGVPFALGELNSEHAFTLRIIPKSEGRKAQILEKANEGEKSGCGSQTF
jgi:hypothetical protein